MERRKGCACISQENSSDLCNESRSAYCLGEADAVVAGVGFGEGGELSARFPVELAAVNDNAADSSAVAADELCCGMNYDICTVLNGTDKIRSTEGVVYYQRDLVLVSDLSGLFDVDKVSVGVAEGLNEDSLGIVPDSILECALFIGINESSADAVLGKSVFEEVVCTAVNGLGSNDVLAGLCQVLDSVSDSSCAGSYCKSCNTALKSSDPLLEDVLSGVGKSAVDVACVLETETVCCVLGVMET